MAGEHLPEAALLLLLVSVKVGSSQIFIAAGFHILARAGSGLAVSAGHISRPLN